MSATEVVLEGAVTEDGRLVIEGDVDLPPGRVRVTVRSVELAAGSEDGFMAGLRRIWAAQEARGFVGRPVQELLADLDVMRNEWDGSEGQGARR